MRVQCQARSAAGPASARCGAPLLALPKLSCPLCRAGDSEPVEQVCFWQQAAFAFHGGAVGGAARRPCTRARIGGFHYRAGWREQSGFRFILVPHTTHARPTEVTQTGTPALTNQTFSLGKFNMNIYVSSLNIWSFYAGGDSNAQLVSNFELGIQKGVWGSEHDSAFTENESTVKNGDYIFMTCGYKRKTNGPNQNRYKDVDALKSYFLQFNRLVIAKVTSNVYHNTALIWEDGIYPVRFNFEVLKYHKNYQLSSLTEIFSNENLDIFRRSMIPKVKARRLDEKHINFEKLGITYIQNEFVARVISDLAAMEYETEYFEGNKKQRFTNYYERKPALRAAAIEIHGTTCMACSFNFEKFYFARGKDFIEVHHTKLVSELGDNTKVDPDKDLIVLCSNCHRMIHRKKDDVLSLNGLISIIK